MTRMNRFSPALILALALLAGCGQEDSPTAPARVLPQGIAPAVGDIVTVMNTDDAGPGSLRQAILDATGGEIIRFDVAIAGGMVVLTSGALSIDKALTIEGSSTVGMTISGGSISRVFIVGPNGDVVFRNLSIVDGRSDGGGGIVNGGSVLIDHSIVAFNEVSGGKPWGGGIKSTGSLTILNSTLTGNVAGNGGAIDATSGDITIRNSTISGNIAGQGAGILTFGTLSLRNTIIAGNFDNSGATSVLQNCDFGSGAGNVTFSGLNISDDATCGTDPALYVGDPMLGPLANNGGPTQTFSLIAGSPAIDNGSSCTLADDQRYVARPQGASCDVGSYEFDDYATLSLTVGPNAMVNAKTGVAIVSGTITCSSPATIPITVDLSQTQRITGRFSTIVQTSGATSVACNGTSAWSVTLTPTTGKFKGGDASASVGTTGAPVGFIPASTTAALKLFLVK